MQLYEQPDSAIAELLQTGNEAALDEIMRRYKHPVLNFAYRMLNDAAEADDVAQEVFVRVYQKIGTYRPRGKFSTWLFALAHNLCIDRLRWRQRHPAESLDDLPDPPAANESIADELDVHEIGAHIARRKIREFLEKMHSYWAFRSPPAISARSQHFA